MENHDVLRDIWNLTISKAMFNGFVKLPEATVADFGIIPLSRTRSRAAADFHHQFQCSKIHWNIGAKSEMAILIWYHLVGGIPTPLKNMISSIGMMNFSIYGKIKVMFQATNQWIWYHTMWGPIVSHSSLINPGLTRVISTQNHSCWSYKPT